MKCLQICGNVKMQFPLINYIYIYKSYYLVVKWYSLSSVVQQETEKPLKLNMALALDSTRYQLSTTKLVSSKSVL